jgi:hypothetical protein
VISLDTITLIVISADAYVLRSRNPNPDLVRAHSLSFGFYLVLDEYIVEFIIPNQTEFETWILGLKHLCRKVPVVEDKISPGLIRIYIFILCCLDVRYFSLDDNDFLQARLNEFYYLQEDLREQAGVLMAIRSSDERSLKILETVINVKDEFNSYFFSFLESESIESNFKRGQAASGNT